MQRTEGGAEQIPKLSGKIGQSTKCKLKYKMQTWLSIKFEFRTIHNKKMRRIKDELRTFPLPFWTNALKSYLFSYNQL